jgi:hypothetical protein
MLLQIKPVLILGTHFATPTAGYIVNDEDGVRFSCTQNN